jgi:pimeloyl-ACP methyl ester carboxylesterase
MTPPAPYVHRIVRAQNALLQGHQLSPHQFQVLPRTAGLNSIVLRPALPAASSSTAAASPPATAAAPGLRSPQTPAALRQPPILLLHGYGAGLGFWFRNLPKMVSRTVFAVDWLGLGGSDRPVETAPRLRFFSCDSKLGPERAAGFFVDSLKVWADAHLTEPAVVVGHSLGGYLAGRFALAHPHMVARLVLASPAGLARQVPGAVVARRTSPRGIQLLDALWSMNFTPQHLVRALGETRGRAAVHRVVGSRFGQVQDWDPALVAEYLFEITRAPPSGEYALNSLLKPPVAAGGVVARVPLETLLLPAAAGRPRFAIHTMFGDHDWLRTPQAVESAQRLGTLDILPQAGHHLYLDNPEHFNRLVMQ